MTTEEILKDIYARFQEEFPCLSDEKSRETKDFLRQKLSEYKKDLEMKKTDLKNTYPINTFSGKTQDEFIILSKGINHIIMDFAQNYADKAYKQGREEMKKDINRLP